MNEAIASLQDSVAESESEPRQLPDQVPWRSFDALIHTPTRLAIVSLLAAVELKLY